MAITNSGYYGLTLAKQFAKTVALDMGAVTTYVALVSDGYTPNFDTHDFHADLTNEIANGDGYTTGGAALAATPAWTVGAPAAGQIAFDSADPAWATSTITDAMAAVLYITTGASATDQLLMLSDFGTAVSTANGTLTVTVDGDGWVYFDYVP